jgi:hypothetical protein
MAELKNTIEVTPKLPEIMAVAWVSEAELRNYKLSIDAKIALSARDALLQ